jgi:geranylgeranyl reductase family protein
MIVSIIGAGPCGCFLGYLLASNGFKVNIYEEHPEIGKPLQCAGIVTSSLTKIMEIPQDIILNRINKARIHSPKGYLRLDLNQNIILDRISFDQWLAELARKAGAKIHLNHRFIRYSKPSITLKHNNNIKYTSTDYLIGADGPLSEVAKYVRKPVKLWTGIQIRAKLENENIVDFYPYIGTFAWVIPENKNVARIGLLAKSNATKIFQRFLTNLGNPKIIDRQAGLVPIYQKKVNSRNNIYLMGDAAAQVKATTGGGIIQGLIAAKCLAKSIIDNEDYEKLLKENLEKDLRLHRRIRKILDNFKPDDYTKLIRFMGKEKVKQIMKEFDRDYPRRYLIKLIIAQPRLLYFLTKLF